MAVDKMSVNQYGIKMPGDKKKKKKESLLAKPKRKSKAKKYDTSALAAGQQVLTERKGRKDRSKKYSTADSGSFARAKKAMTTDKAYALPFGETFKQARKEGKKTFRWKSKQYHTKTKDELEKATGAKEKERFERAGKAKETTKKRNIFQKIARKMRGTNPDGSTRTQAEYEAAKAKRKSKAK